MKKLVLIFITLMFLIQSCTERIDIELDESYSRLVVYGLLTTDTTTHYVELTKTTSYYNADTPPPVRNALVEIADNEGQTVVLGEISPGRYATPSDYYVIPGNTYTLFIELEEEINGHRTFTASSVAPSFHPIDSVKIHHLPDWGTDGFYEVQCWYQDPPERNFYMFNIYKNGILITDTINKRFVTDDAFFNGNYTNGIGVGYLNQSYERERVLPDDTITFQGCGITEEFYEFVISLQQQTGFQTPLFSGPPANLNSNVSNGAVGFFTAYAVSYGSVVYHP